jgi:hypothetical protein
MVHILPTLIPADGGGILVGGHDVVVTDPVTVRALIGGHRPVLRGDTWTVPAR